MRIANLVFILLFMASPLAAQTPEEQALRDQLARELAKDEILANVMVDFAADGLVDPIAYAIGERLKRLDPSFQMSERMEWDIDAAIKSLIEEQFDSPEVLQKLFPKLLKNFNQKELQELLAFYITPLGKKTVLQLLMFVDGLASSTRKVLDDQFDQLVAEMTSPLALAKPAATKTVIGLRNIAVAVESYGVDEGHYPAARNLDELKAQLVPKYLESLPEKDAWGTAFVYVVSEDAQQYRIVSAGADGRVDPAHQGQSLFQTSPGSEMKITVEPAADIVWQNGAFLQIPKTLSK